MSKLETKSSNKIFLSIIQGTFRQNVNEGTKEAVRREWEAGGKSGVKYELVYNSIVGKIVNVNFHDGESEGRKFTNLNITLDENEGEKQPVISIGISTRYAQDILKKLPNVDFGEEVRIRPYSFQPEGEDKTITGVEITQRDGAGQFNKKIISFFHKKVNDKWENKSGYPEPEGDTSTYTTDDWDIFYKQARKFLVNYTKENICPIFEQTYTPKSYEEEQELKNYPEADDEGIKPEDIPS